MSEKISLLTHAEWCKCLNPRGMYGGEVLRRLESDERNGDGILLTWEQFKVRVDEALGEPDLHYRGTPIFFDKEPE